MLRFLKKILYLYLAFFFFRLGIIGLIFPIIPQVPFFVLSFMFLAGASRHFRKFIVSTKMYKKFLKGYVDKHPKIAAFFYDETDDTKHDTEYGTDNDTGNEEISDSEEIIINKDCSDDIDEEKRLGNKEESADVSEQENKEDSL